MASTENTGLRNSPEFQDNIRKAMEAEARYLQSNDQRDLDQLVAAWERVLQHPSFAAIDPNVRLPILNAAGVAFWRHHRATGQLSDLDCAIRCWQEAMQETPPDSPHLPSVLSHLGGGLRERYYRTGDQHDLEEAVNMQRRAVEQTPSGSEDLPIILSDLGTSLKERYARTGALTDLDEAIVVQRRALEQTPLSSPYRLSLLNNLGNGLRQRYAWTGNLAELEEAIRLHRQAVQQTPPGSSGRLNNLGIALRELYARSGDLEHLEEAIHAWRLAVQNAPPRSPELSDYLNNLGNGLRERYACNGNIEDLEEAIRLHQQVARRTPTGSPDLPSYQSSLGSGLLDRYDRNGDLQDLDEAIRLHRQSLERTHPGSPDLPSRFRDLGMALSLRYHRTGIVEDLDEAVRLYRQAVGHMPSTSPRLPTLLDELGSALSDQYNRDGVIAYLEEAVQIQRQAVERMPTGSPNLLPLLGNLGVNLRERYVRTRAVKDLDEAISVQRRAAELALPGSALLPSVLSNLGATLLQHYMLTEAPEELDEVIRLQRQALEHAPRGSPDLSSKLNNLGFALKECFDRTGHQADLDEAINTWRRAVENAVPGSPDLPTYLNNLGGGLSVRHNLNKALEDLEEAIRVYQQAVQCIPSSSPDLASWLGNLGMALMARHARNGDLADLDEAISAWERAFAVSQSTFLGAPVSYKLGQEGQGAALHARLVNAYLRRAVAIPIQRILSLRSALEVAEASKSRLLIELVGRGELPTPLSVEPHHIDSERMLLDELTSLDTAELAAHGHPTSAQGEASRLLRFQQRNRCLQNLQVLWATIAESGAEGADYVALRRSEPLKWDDFAHLAADLGAETALLSLFTTGDRTQLFVLRGGWEEPEVVEAELDGNSWADIARRFFREVHNYDGTDRRQETWDRLLRPMLERVLPHLNGVKTVVFAPQALGHILPWAVVAWRAGWGGPDGFPLSLVTLPALGLLSSFKRRPIYTGSKMLVVGDPTGDLKYARGEAQEVARMMGTMPVIGSQATKAEILARISESSVIHLATHAYFSSGSPLDSSIVLADGVLSAREILRQRLQADLLVLSGCETGMAEALAGNELAGLAQAFLHAGVRSLLVSLWSVDDPATASLMTTFYATHLAGANNAQALKQAMAHVRSQEKWCHPYYWGAFVLIGN